ncbi:MAG: sugar efflux transporter [Chroococcidiopsis sp. SAG 2025]|uniref:MFS transporter n=1 Tax=Chroococcidiopsis sp. SAG 2025 TaxID=171389 RepID=UPI0029370A32|nr:MFS transporter [Chroococcidiopsis sp. SAG 2025]MDV2997061.1 sugar efflux transporter [Chroococcidiopsis sp. SAG 2025]
MNGKQKIAAKSSERSPASGTRQQRTIPKSIWALALSAFAIITFEFVVVGLLPLIARDFSIELDRAGWLLTAFAFIVALSGPILTALTAQVNRRQLFLFLLVIFVGANILCALAPNFWILMLARVIPAPALALFWSVVSVAAGKLVPEALRGRASAIVFAGISIAAVLGVPLGTYIASLFSWRMAYIAVGSLTVLALLALYLWLPEVPGATKGNALGQISTLKQPALIVGLAVSGVAFTGMFAAYTYLTAFLENISGFAISSSQCIDLQCRNWSRCSCWRLCNSSGWLRVHWLGSWIALATSTWFALPFHHSLANLNSDSSDFWTIRPDLPTVEEYLS